MARIRTVKPELWTDEDFMDLSLTARLMFIASLNFADDYGVLADKPRTLAARCLPNDEIDAPQVVDELVDSRFFTRTLAPDGSPVLVIRTFGSHQKIDKRTKGRWGDPSEWENGPIPPEPPPIPPHPAESHPIPPTEGKGRERKGKEPSSVFVDTQGEPVDSLEEEGDSKKRQIIDIEAKRRLHERNATTPVANQTRWLETVVKAITEEHGKEIDRIIREYPTAPYDVIAAAAIHGERRSLAHHARHNTEQAKSA